MNPLRDNVPPQPIATAVALLISLGVLALSVAGFAKVDDHLGLFAGKDRQGIITLEVLAD